MNIEYQNYINNLNGTNVYKYTTAIEDVIRKMFIYYKILMGYSVESYNYELFKTKMITLMI